MIATTVVIILHTAADLVFFKEIKDFTLDTVMYYHSDFEPTLATGKKMQRMAIAIDDKTYREWGVPVITPRNKLKMLIEKSAQREVFYCSLISLLTAKCRMKNK